MTPNERMELCDGKRQLNKRRFLSKPVAFSLEYPMTINLNSQVIHHKIAGDLYSRNTPVPDKTSAKTPQTGKDTCHKSEEKFPIPPFGVTSKKATDMQPDSVNVSSNELKALHEKIALLEKDCAALKVGPTTHASTAQHTEHEAPPLNANAKLKTMAHAVKTAFANAPWEKIGKGALYATVAVAAFAVLSNPLGAISAVGMLMGSSLLPTAIGLGGAGYAVHKTHQWLNKKPDQDSPPQSAAASLHGDGAFSQSLGNRA
jgi:hypothetical protein